MLSPYNWDAFESGGTVWTMHPGEGTKAKGLHNGALSWGREETLCLRRIALFDDQHFLHSRESVIARHLNEIHPGI